MRITERMIDGGIRRILSAGRFSSASNGKLSDEVRSYFEEKGITTIWNAHDKLGLFLARIDKFHAEAERLFGTGKVGVLIFLNGTEPELPADRVRVKKGDIIEVAYVGEGPGPARGCGNKSDFFEAGDKRGYSSPYRRENEWRRPKGAS